MSGDSGSEDRPQAQWQRLERLLRAAEIGKSSGSCRPIAGAHADDLPTRKQSFLALDMKILAAPRCSWIWVHMGGAVRMESRRRRSACVVALWNEPRAPVPSKTMIARELDISEHTVKAHVLRSCTPSRSGPAEEVFQASGASRK
jgi:hypothetical protein